MDRRSYSAYTVGMEPGDPAARWSGGPCPSCPGTGALLILRRAADGKILFHCRRCGLSFTHEAEGAEPESGRSLEAVAPGGARPATFKEIAAAGLSEHARLLPGDSPSPPRKPVPVLRSSVKSESSGTAKAIGGVGGALLLLKILFIVLKGCSH